MTDYAALKAEIAKPQYAGMTDAQIAAALVTPTPQPTAFPWESAKALARGASTQDWSRIVARARQPVTLPAPGSTLDATTQGVLLAINAVESQPGDMIDPANTAGWTEFQLGLGALEQMGDLSAQTVTEITALGTISVIPAVTFGFDPAINDMAQEIAAARKWSA